jgi:hypothetical protein
MLIMTVGTKCGNPPIPAFANLKGSDLQGKLSLRLASLFEGNLNHPSCVFIP